MNKQTIEYVNELIEFHEERVLAVTELGNNWVLSPTLGKANKTIQVRESLCLFFHFLSFLKTEF